MCGGTCRAAQHAERQAGLSPRVRGNLYQVYHQSRSHALIPSLLFGYGLILPCPTMTRNLPRAPLRGIQSVAAVTPAPVYPLKGGYTGTRAGC